MIPSSPSWYCSSVLVKLGSTKYAFASKSSFFVFEVDDDSGIINLKRQTTGENEKCTAIVKLTSNQLIVASDTGLIRQWCVPNDSSEPIKLEEEYQPNNLSVTALDASDGVIVSGDTKAFVFITQTSNKSSLKIRENDQHNGIQSIKLHSETSMVAVGFNLGIIYVYKIDGSKVARLRGHENAIQSFIWHKSGLISAAKDRQIRLWDIDSGKCSQILNLPRASGYKSKKNNDDAKIWISLTNTDCEDEFISSGMGGDIMLWRLSENGDQFRNQPEIFCERQTDLTHQRTVFGLSAGDGTLISISMDRQIKVWDLNLRKPKFNLMTNGGWVYSLAACPSDPNMVAMGVGDGILRVWDTQDKPRVIRTTWQGISEKITALSWHNEQSRVAFGTEHGKVGIWYGDSNKVDAFNTFHDKKVYSVDFLGDDVISCDGCSLKIYEQKECRNVKLPGKPSSLKVGGEMIAIGFDSGSVGILDQNFDLVCVKELHSKYITSLCYSPNKEILASACNSGSVVISHGKNLETFRKIAGHMERVTDLDFSPDGTQLVTASTDRSCQVWNVSDGMPVANYRAHTSAVLSILWLNDGIYSGSEDCVLDHWTVSACNFTIPPEKVKRDKPNRKKNESWRKPATNISPNAFKPRLDDSQKQNHTQPATTKPEPRAKKAHKFAINRAEDDRRNQRQLVDGIQDLVSIQRGDQPTPDHLIFYNGTKNQVVDSIMTQMKNDPTYNAELSTWLGTYVDVVNSEQITDTVVALSASMGTAVWRFVAERYVLQLEKEYDYAKASTYLVALGRVEDAVKALNKGHLYRDSLVLARLRLGEHHKLIEETLLLQAERATHGGCNFMAAKSLLAAGDTEEAIRRLQKSSKPEYTVGVIELLVGKGEDVDNISDVVSGLINPLVTVGRLDELTKVVHGQSSSVCRQLSLFVLIHKALNDQSIEGDIEFLRQDHKVSIFSDETVTEDESLDNKIRIVKALVNFAIDGLPRLLPEHLLFETYQETAERLSI